MDITIPKSTPLIRNSETPPNPYEVTRNDPEWLFVQSHFETQPQENRHRERVYCIHNEVTLLPILEEEAKAPALIPK